MIAITTTKADKEMRTAILLVLHNWSLIKQDTPAFVTMDVVGKAAVNEIKRLHPDAKYEEQEILVHAAKMMGKLADEKLIDYNEKTHCWITEEGKKYVTDKEKLRQELLIDDVFANEKRPYKSVGQGVHNDVFYYGTTIERGGKSATCIVTSDRKYYIGQDIRDKFGLNYREEFDDAAIDFGWSNAAISRYLKGEHNNVDIKILFSKIMSIFERYMEFLNSTTSKYLTCCVLSDYCYWLFSHKGRIYFTAEKGSGKTKVCKLYWLMGFNTMWISNTSEASLFRSIEATSGTPVVDNEDNLCEDAKLALEQQWQTGFGQESMYRRVEGEKVKRTRKFVNFSPMVKNNIVGMGEVSLDRTHLVKLLRTTSDKGRLQPNLKDPIYEEIRNDIRVWILENWKNIQNITENLELIGLENREIDVEKAPLTVAKIIGEDLFVELSNYVKEHWANRKLKSFDTDWGYFLFREIYNILGEQKIVWISYGDLADKLVPEFYGTSELTDKSYKKTWNSTNRWIARHLAGIPLFDKTRTVHGRTEVFIEADKLKQWIRLQNYPIELNSSNLTNYSTISTYPTDSPKSTVSTNSTKIEVDMVEMGDMVEQERQNKNR